ncbi:hypothetical protein BRW65_20310 [Mycobacterium paraffinicum]|uniref:Transport acessory protein MmpS n=1 Tax=Mycobacterium paraffinicum TaxID=53378 RepID=A0A1Q4HQW7_9MYCO|nr:MmpS family transport accessory protein [Mycobacterium paraffinicum]OJZ70313.1 hypothetical protein BRW65_20310 [Mycobacterium paraffinicum]
MRVLRRQWLPLLVVVVVVLGVLTIGRLHGVFGSDTEITREGSGIANDTKPFNPKRITYTVFGPIGATATINYLDLSANPQSLQHAALPWTLTLTTVTPSAVPILIAQGDAESIGCRISVDGEVKDENSGQGVTAFTFCQVKSA